jgi:hypothetical protein
MIPPAYRDSMTKPDTPFDTPLDIFDVDMNINAISVWAAAHAATNAWLADPQAIGPEGASFIFTGNLFNETVAPGFLPFGMAKAASAHLIQYLALLGFEGKPFKYVSKLLAHQTSTDTVPHTYLPRPRTQYTTDRLIHRFYYVDEREFDGTPMWRGPNGAAHAEEFLALAKDPKQRAWQYTFAKGEGYKKFEIVEALKLPA